MAKKAPVKDQLTVREDRRRVEAETIRKLAEEFDDRIQASLGTIRPSSDTSLEATVLVAMLQRFDERLRGECGTLRLGWIAERYAARRLEDRWARLLEIHNSLVSRHHHSSNRFNYNDLDNYAYYIPWQPCGEARWDTLKLMVWKDQNFKWLLMLQEPLIDPTNALHRAMLLFTRQLHIRELHRRLGRNCIGYVDRATIRWYKERGWEPRYGDFRDHGYVLSYKMQIVEGALHHWAWINRFLMEINFLWTALEEQEQSHA